jgi:hypothetical protein
MSVHHALSRNYSLSAAVVADRQRICLICQLPNSTLPAYLEVPKGCEYTEVHAPSLQAELPSGQALCTRLLVACLQLLLLLQTACTNSFSCLPRRVLIPHPVHLIGIHADAAS